MPHSIKNLESLSPRRPWHTVLMRGGFLALGFLLCLFFGRSSSAEFEVSPVSSLNALNRVELRGVWAFHRGIRLDASTSINGYEAFAVGINADINDEHTNGVLYFYDGTIWKRVATPFDSAYPGGGATPVAGSVYSLNAIVGQENAADGNPSPLWVAGSNGRIGAITTYRSPPPTNFLSQTITGITSTETRDFYALDAASGTGLSAFAGGQAGLVAFKPVSTDTWRVIIPTREGGPHLFGTAESVTAIKYVDDETVFVLTTAFADTTDNHAPNKHLCDGIHTAYLYRFSTRDETKWYNLASFNTCAYGLAVGDSLNVNPDARGGSEYVIWIATANGVYRVANSSIGTASTPVKLPNTDTKAYYAVTAIHDLGGGSNLLTNPSFNLHQVEANGTANNLPANWRVGEAKHLVASECVTNTADYTVADGGSTFVVTPSPAFKDDGCTQPEPYVNEGAEQRIDLSTYEGQRFRLQGRYKVEFLGTPNGTTPSTLDPTAPGWPDAPAPQGGVAIGCSGPTDPGFANCSLRNRKFIRVFDGNTAPLYGATSGWASFDLTFSRNDLLFSTIETSGGSLTPARMSLTIRCEATYGAKVSCDDFSLTQVDEPATPPKNSYTVIAAGANLSANGIAVITDGEGATPIFSRAGVPSKIRADATVAIQNDINAIAALGTQHLFAVGRGTTTSNGQATGITLLNRTPTTLTGTIWVGATTPNGTANPSPVGSINASCVNADAILPSLCQRSPESYGLSLDINGTGDTRIGSLVGRAWFGKTNGANYPDVETLDLGQCLRHPDIDPDNPSFNLVNLCDSTSHRCWSNDTPSKVLTTNACLTDFDCYGRCERDEGHLCVRDADCRITNTSLSGDLSSSTGNVDIFPANRLACAIDNPLACSAIGWLSFDPADFTLSEQAPPSDTFGVSYNTRFSTHNANYQLANKGAHELAGWGRFTTLAAGQCTVSATNTTSRGKACHTDTDCGDITGSTCLPSQTGWVRLRGDDVTPVAATIEGTPSFFGCRDCDGGGVNAKNCAFCQDADSHSCVPSNDGAGQAKCYYYCQNTTTHCSTNSDCTGADAGKPCVAPGFCSIKTTGGATVACTGDLNCSSAGLGYCAFGAICQRTGGSCAKYGVNLDTETGKFYGSAWSQDFGWLDFQTVTYGGSRLVQTKLGDIYATQQIGVTGTPTPVGGESCNSTYLITSASTITGFCSALGSAGKQELVNPIPIISAENTFQNILGRFDLKGIETVTTGGKNKYGSKIVQLATSPTPLDISPWLTDSTRMPSGTLAGKVFIIGDAGSYGHYSIDSTITFNNATSLDPTDGGPGSGIIIVNGDLTINAPLAYPTTSLPVGDLRKLASLTVVVRGNLKIENHVENVVGAYYVTDNPTAPAGKFSSTTNPDVDNVYPLTVKGLVIAKTFDLKRKFAGTIENPLPSELFIYDGRLQSNPLPGVNDFAAALPNAAVVGP